MKKITCLFSFILLAVFSYAQGHFVPAFIGSGQNQMNIFVLTGTIEGIDLEAGDEIAVFDGTICCGIAILTQPIVITDYRTFAALVASEKETGLINGYTSGNAITYKIWDSSKNKELSGISTEYFDAITTLPTTTPIYEPGGSAFVKLSVSMPNANAGPDQLVDENGIFTLDGSASSDPDNQIMTYLWTPPNGITLSSTTSVNPTFTAPEVITNTKYTFSLIVNDGDFDSPIDQVEITVKQVNKAPVANSGIDQSVNEGSTVTLDGSASNDPDNDALTYLWTAPDGITLSSLTAANPTFTAPEVMTTTDFTFSLVVNDGTLSSTADQITVQVKQVNKAPVANAGADQSANEGSMVTLDGTASTDPDSDVLTYLWTAPDGITLSSTTVAKPTFTAPEVMTTTDFTFTLIVSDGTLSSTADQITVQVKQVNKAPVANSGTDQSVNEGSTVTLDGTASTDPDNDVLTYLWTAPDGLTLSSTTAAKPTFTAPEVMTTTDFTFTLIVNDGTLSSIADQITVQVKQVNKAPVANAGADQSVNEGLSVTLDGTASADADNDGLTYLWTAPAGVTLSSATAAKPTFTAPEVMTNSNYTFSLVVSDGALNSTADQITVQVKQVNKAPVANAGIDQSVNEGTTVTLDGTASTDPDSDVLTYLWTAPAGITLSSLTAAKPTFTAPEVMNTTDFTFSLVVNDGTLNSTADQVVVQVKQVNRVPVANAGIDQSVNEGSTVTLDGTASTDPDSDILTYLWTAPDGITLSSLTAAKPTFTAPEMMTNTDFTFLLVVNDGILSSTADQITVQVKQVNKAPVANAGPDQETVEFFTVYLDGSLSSDPDHTDISYHWIAPAGITLSSATAQSPRFIVSGIKSDTIFTFSLVVNDGTLDSPADLVLISVKNYNRAPQAKVGPDQIVNEAATVILDGSASFDPDGSPLTYTWTAPEGITLSSTTDAKPTFTAPLVVSDVNYEFTLTVNDGSLSSQAERVIIRVTNTNFSYHFKPVWYGNGFDHMNIYATQFQLDGIDLEDGDEIGVYDGDFCVGVGNLSERKWTLEIVSINVSAKNIAGNGYVTDHPISYKFYDKSADKEVEICSVTYASNNPLWDTDGKFTPGASAFVSLKCTGKATQDIVLNTGWNIISANLIPANLNMKDIFQMLIDAGKLKKVMDEAGKTMENFGAFGGWKNNIGYLNAAKGYKVNVTAASTLSLEGTPVSLPFELALATGWNIISYPSATVQDAKALVQSLIDAGKLKKVMDETGKTIENFGAFGGWKNNIGNFLPGKGYKVSVTENCILTIPANGTKAATIVPEVLASSHFIKAFKGNGIDHAGINLVNLQASGLQAGDEIGIYDGKFCVGSQAIGAEDMLSGIISIPASACDELGTTINGFTPGHPVVLKLFHNNREYALKTVTLQNSQSSFAKGESLFAQVSIGQTTELIENGNQASVNCYPNPFNDQLTIEIQLPEAGKLDVTIFDSGGKLVRKLFRGRADEAERLYWDGRDGRGVRMVPGTYFLKVNDRIEKVVMKSE